MKLHRIWTGHSLVYTTSPERVAQLLDEALAGTDVHLVHRLQWLAVIL